MGLACLRPASTHTKKQFPEPPCTTPSLHLHPLGSFLVTPLPALLAGWRKNSLVYVEYGVSMYEERMDRYIEGSIRPRPSHPLQSTANMSPLCCILCHQHALPCLSPPLPLTWIDADPVVRNCCSLTSEMSKFDQRLALLYRCYCLTAHEARHHEVLIKGRHPYCLRREGGKERTPGLDPGPGPCMAVTLRWLQVLPHHA